MEKMKKKLSENILDKLSMDFLRNQVLKNAYGNDDTFIAALDPRLLFIWYVFFALVPWFVDDLIFLLGCFIPLWQKSQAWCCSCSEWAFSPRPDIFSWRPFCLEETEKPWRRCWS